MMKKTLLIVLLMIVTGHLSLLRAVELLENGKVILPDKVTGKITIDGSLEEAVWQQAPINKVFKSVHPTYGEVLDRETRIWAAYDRKNLYFAFKCLETDPSKIKTSIARRDAVMRDDYVGVLLDAQGSRQSSYEFYSNPNGIQMDAINSAVSGPDITPDFVWDSAGKVTADGYQVEIRIPLESIRYKSGKEVKMGIAFFRSVSHLGLMAVWPEIPAGQTDFNVMAAMVYKDLRAGLKLEVLPNVTYSRDSERVTADTWDRNTDTNVGFGLKYGITSSITAEAAVNPDFSQVESDVFQVEVNRRYPIFYSEKRPFFMESKEVMDFSIINNGMMLAPVHTRLIIDPGWAGKLSGSSGKMNFALLAANDRSAGRAWDQGVNPDQGKSALFGIFRAKYNIGSDNSLGMLYTGRYFAGQQNNVLGLDLKYRLSKNLRASLSYLNSAARQAEDQPLERGSGVNAMLEYTTSTLLSWAVYERYSTDFFMATAFQNRVGISRGGFALGPVFNMKKVSWITRIVPSVQYYRLYDLETRMTDITRKYSVSFAFAPQGELSLEYWHEDEAWAGKVMDKKYFYSTGGIQLFKWLYLYQDTTIGEQIYYHPSDPFVGNSKTFLAGFILEPGRKLKIGFSYLYSDLSEKQSKQKIYSVDIYNLHTTYQFNKYLFLRGILRYDSYQGKLLTDLLASFTFIPGTVVHLGYGSLHLENQWQDNRWIAGQGGLLKMKQGLFFKASYLWRIN